MHPTMATEAHQLVEEKVTAVVVARHNAVLEAEVKCKAEAEHWVEEMKLEQGGRSPAKQKGWVEGEQVAA